METGAAARVPGQRRESGASHLLRTVACSDPCHQARQFSENQKEHGSCGRGLAQRGRVQQRKHRRTFTAFSFLFVSASLSLSTHSTRTVGLRAPTKRGKRGTEANGKAERCATRRKQKGEKTAPSKRVSRRKLLRPLTPAPSKARRPQKHIKRRNKMRSNATRRSQKDTPKKKRDGESVRGGSQLQHTHPTRMRLVVRVQHAAPACHPTPIRGTHKHTHTQTHTHVEKQSRNAAISRFCFVCFLLCARRRSPQATLTRSHTCTDTPHTRTSTRGAETSLQAHRLRRTQLTEKKKKRHTS